MNGINWDDEDDDEFEGQQTFTQGNLPKELRKVIREAKKAEKEARDEADALRKQVRESLVSNVLTSKGVPAKVAKLIPADVTSAEAIETWLTEYGDVFGSSTTAAPSGEQKTETTNGQAFIDNATTSTAPQGEEIAAMQRMQNTAQTAQPFGGRMDELASKLNDPNLTEEQLDALISKGGL